MAYSTKYFLEGDQPVFQVNQFEDVLILKLSPDPVNANYQSKHLEYNRLIQQLNGSSCTNLLFDMSECQTLDSIMIGMLVHLTFRVREREGNAVMTGLSPSLSELLFSLMQLEKEGKRAVWTSYESIESALSNRPW